MKIVNIDNLMETSVEAKHLTRKFIVAGVAGLATLVGASSVLAADLTVEAAGIRNQDGALFVTVYDDGRAFKADRVDKAFAVSGLAIRGGQVRFTLHDVPSGSYAVSLFHDEDNNGEFDMRRGIPVEGYGISNSRDSLDEPGFDRASVKIDKDDRTIRVQLYYLD